MPISLLTSLFERTGYHIWIDWDGDGGIDLGNFESGLDFWEPAGINEPTLSQSDTRAHSGAKSLLVEWQSSSVLPAPVNHKPGEFIVGVTYTLSGWVYVPTGSEDVLWQVLHLGLGGFGAPTSVKDAWTEMTFSFVPTQAGRVGQISIWPENSPTTGQVFHLDDVMLTSPGEDVTGRVLARTPLTVSYGRDQDRALSPMAAGQAAFELDNRSGDYYPENTSSPLAGYILPSRPVRIVVDTTEGAATLFRGYTDDYELRPHKMDRSVGITAVDPLGRFREATVSTGLHHAIRTGEAIGVVLDELGWPADLRDLDAGATVIPWWWEDGTDAMEALTRLVQSEGTPALLYVEPASGNVTFRDRHHRLIRAESLTPQTVLRASGTEPCFSAPLGYDQGWRDVYNSVTFEVVERQPVGDLQVVWSSDRSYSLSAGETLLVSAQPSDPVVGAVPPVAGTDFTVRSGTVTATLSRTAGGSVTIFLTATSVPAVIDGLQLRAYPLTVRRTVQVHEEDAESIRRNGGMRRSYPHPAPWAGEGDARAIAAVVLAHRAERLPIVQPRLVSGDTARLTQQLSRRLSDRVTVVEPVSGLDGDFYVERVQHTLTEAGKIHDSTFGCEKVPAQVEGVFQFDTAGRGFNDGLFGLAGLDNPGSMFRFDVVGQGFDQGLMAT